MPTFVLIAGAAGALSAAAYGALLAGSFGALILAYLAQLPLFLVGLWSGVTGVLVSGAVATVLAGAVGGAIFGVVFFAINAVPVAIIVRQALLSRTGADGTTEWYPPGLLIGWLISLAGAGFLAFALMMSGEEGGLEGSLREQLKASLKAFASDSADAATLDEIANAMARFFPGITAVSWVVMLAINGALAQGILVRFQRNRRPSPRMEDIELPSWVLPAAALTGVAAFFPGFAGFIGGNLVLIGVLAFVLAGLGVIHALTRHWKLRPMVLSFVYFSVFFLGWPVLPVGFLGLVEPWAKLRQRNAGPPPNT